MQAAFLSAGTDLVRQVPESHLKKLSYHADKTLDNIPCAIGSSASSYFTLGQAAAVSIPSPTPLQAACERHAQFVARSVERDNSSTCQYCPGVL